MAVFFRMPSKLAGKTEKFDKRFLYRDGQNGMFSKCISLYIVLPECFILINVACINKSIYYFHRLSSSQFFKMGVMFEKGL